ncbi:MAG: hypothetical protein ACO1NM_03940 [Sphingobium phenoxybenzoativorans]|jgi:hypothetical protein|uniref:hypothetical protein n=1 Tax=Sphingobium phenoxybenzoativorans TaxID=1592790 RepID=UPI0009F35E4F|nr:hypothetical protein [Sphingobium phenoxybenzoativorans]
MLPPGFETIEKYVGYWDVPTTSERWERRAAASMDEIRAFYDDMLAHADQALDVIALHDINAMPDDVATLARLMLALMSAAVAIEVVGAPRDPYSPYPHSVRVLRGPSPWG